MSTFEMLEFNVKCTMQGQTAKMWGEVFNVA